MLHDFSQELIGCGAIPHPFIEGLNLEAELTSIKSFHIREIQAYVVCIDICVNRFLKLILA